LRACEELGGIIETSAKKLVMQQNASSRFASIVTLELKAVLAHAKKMNAATPNIARVRLLCRALHDVLEFRIQLWQIYVAIGTRRLRSLSMERASQSVEALWSKLEQSALAQFEPQSVYVTKLESLILAALLRSISHTARMQFAPTLLASADV
jgi:hypothetical protein